MDVLQAHVDLSYDPLPFPFGLRSSIPLWHSVIYPFLASMAACGRKLGYPMASNLVKTLARSSNFASNSRSLSGVVNAEVITSHTAKWMQDMSKKSPMELINEVPPIKVEGRIVACEGDNSPALGHPIEFICLDLDQPAVCKYCGLRYLQNHGHHH